MSLFRLARGVALTSLFLTATASIGHGAGLRCRSDPFVLLSDGTVVDLQADIGALLWQVQTIDYVLHVPQGLKPVLVVRTPNWPTTRERFTILADRPQGVYDSTTFVRTSKVTAQVTAQMLVRLNLKFKSGYERQPLNISILTH